MKTESTEEEVKQEPKEYPVTGWKEMIDLVNADRKETFLVDLFLALSKYADVVTSIKLLDPSLKDTPNSEIIEFGFTWIDDGEHSNPSTQITNTTTGRTIEISKQGVKDVTQNL